MMKEKKKNIIGSVNVFFRIKLNKSDIHENDVKAYMVTLKGSLNKSNNKIQVFLYLLEVNYFHS